MVVQTEVIQPTNGHENGAQKQSDVDAHAKRQGTPDNNHGPPSSWIGNKVYWFQHLFFSHKFIKHRVIGLAFLVQFFLAAYLYVFDYERYLRSVLVWSLPLTGLCQSINAALTFTFLPRKEDPGFAAVADKSVLSYFTVLENSFYSMQLLFACCYFHDDIKPLIQKCVVIEPIMVFFVFYLRHLWPSSRIGAALANAKNKSEDNRTMLTISTYAIKCFYLLAKHFVGTFPLYLRFLGRVTPADQKLWYGVEILSAYASTISIFIHTLKFKGYIGPKTAMVAYDIIIPLFAYLYWNMIEILTRNVDVMMISGVGLILNLAPSVYGVRPWFVWQAVVAYLFYTGYPIHTIPELIDPRIYLAVLLVVGAVLFRK